jgi:hypothetical protein
VVDFSTPAAPVVVAQTQDAQGGKLQDVALTTIGGDTFTLGTDVFFVNGVPIVDVTRPASPGPRPFLGFSKFRDDNGHGIGVDSSYVYLTAERGVTDLGTTDDTRLYIGQYQQIVDNSGVPPSVQITSPTVGPLIAGSTITISAEATDDIAGASVSLLLNDQVVFTSSAAPCNTSSTTRSRWLPPV